MRRESSGCQAPLSFDRMWSVFAVPLHQFVGIGQEDGRTQEGQVNENFPLDVFGIFVRDVHKGLEEMNAGDSDE